MEVKQTSTNGLFHASLGCDGDMDTFSLTNSGGNQSWSMTLKNKSRIIWIFVRIAAGKRFDTASKNNLIFLNRTREEGDTNPKSWQAKKMIKYKKETTPFFQNLKKKSYPFFGEGVGS